MGEIFEEVCGKHGATLREFSGEPDHVHLLIEFSPSTRFSDLVRALKSVSSKKLEKSLIRKFGNISGESDFGQGVTVLFPWETEQRQRQLSATSKVKNDLHHNLPLSIRGLTTAEFRAFC